MMKIRPSTPADIAAVIDIWRKAVDATHHFLSPQDRIAIEREVTALFPKTDFLLAVDDNDKPLGFMLLNDGHLDALFVAPDQHGRGIGSFLITGALVDHPNLTTDVNEQNDQALGFYERLGFEPVGRSELDGQGRPYPLVHLRFKSST